MLRTRISCPGTAWKTATLYALLLTSLTAGVGIASAPNHLWSRSAGGTPDDAGRSVAFDGAGNTYVTGGFQGTANFGGGNLVSAGGSDAFIVKYGADGAHAWSQRFGDANSSAGVSVAVDGSGNVFLAGHFTGSIDLGGGPLVSAGLGDVWIVKLDEDGAHQWSRSFGGVEGEGVYPISVDGAGNVYLTGYFLSTVNFGGGPLVSAGFDDIYLVKYDADGAHVWSRRFGTAGHESGSAVAVDHAGNVYATGIFGDSLNLGGSTLMSASAQDIYLARFNTAGTHQWSRAFPSPMLQYCTSLAVDASGAVTATGHFQGSVDFGGGAIASASFYDIFLARYDANGVHQWSQGFGGASGDFGFGVALDASENVILTGVISGTVDFGGGGLDPAIDGAMVLASFDSSGAHRWSQNYGGAGAGPAVASVAVSATGPIAVTGSFVGTIDFGGGPLTSQAGRNDIFIAAFGPSTSGVDEAPRNRPLSVGNHPNPFRPRTTLHYTLPARDAVTIAIYDVVGARVATLVDGDLRDAGPHEVVWDGRNSSGSRVPAGTYFARVEQRGVVRAHKLVLVE